MCVHCTNLGDDTIFFSIMKQRTWHFHASHNCVHEVRNYVCCLTNCYAEEKIFKVSIYIY